MRLVDELEEKTKRESSTDVARARPLAEVELVRNMENCFERYRELYKTKYSVYPIFPSDQAAKTIVKDTLRKVPEGPRRVIAMFERFLAATGYNGIYDNRKHDLELFKRDAHIFQAEAAERELRVTGTNFTVSFWTGCRNFELGCREQFEVTCKASEMEKHSYMTACPECRKNPGRFIGAAKPKAGTGPLVKSL